MLMLMDGGTLVGFPCFRRLISSLTIIRVYPRMSGEHQKVISFLSVEYCPNLMYLVDSCKEVVTECLF